MSELLIQKIKYLDENNVELEQENAKLKERVAKLTDALKEIVNGPHAGEGFCYARYGYRTCNCYRNVASEALKESAKQDG